MDTDSLKHRFAGGGMTDQKRDDTPEFDEHVGAMHTDGHG